jgi:hypothetical protein
MRRRPAARDLERAHIEHVFEHSRFDPIMISASALTDDLLRKARDWVAKYLRKIRRRGLSSVPLTLASVPPSLSDMRSRRRDNSMVDWHPLFGPSATILWFPDLKTPTTFDFREDAEADHGCAIERWWSVRDAIKYVAANSKPGFRGWLLVNAEVFHPDRILAAAAVILRQDQEDSKKR